MSRDASGTYTPPSGNPVVSGTNISSTVHNNTIDDIGDELTDSLSRSGKGGMTAALELDDGTVSLPGLSFTADTNTGLYRPAADELNVALAGDIAAAFTALGLEIYHATADDPEIALYSDAGTLLSRLRHTGASELKLLSLEHGLPVQLAGEDTGGTERVIFAGDPDAESALYHAGTLTARTRATGFQVGGATPIFEFQNAAFDTRLGYLFMDAGSSFDLRSESAGAIVRLQGHDALDAAQSLFTGDPDGAAVLFYDGTNALVTTSSGIAVRHPTSNEPQVLLEDSVGVNKSLLNYDDAQARTELNSLVAGSSIALQASDSGGTTRNLLTGDPDGALVSYFDGSAVFASMVDGLAIERAGNGYNGLAVGNGGMLLTANGMNASGNDFTPSVWFGSTDSAFTTANPKRLVSLAGRALETYAADADGGMNLDIHTSPTSPGTNPTPILTASFGAVDTVLYYNGNAALNITSVGAEVQAQSTDPRVALLDSTAAEKLRLWWTGDTGYLDVRTTGSDLRLRAIDSSGSIATLFVGDGDGAVTLYYDGTSQVQTQDNDASGNTTGMTVRHHDGAFYDVGMNVMPTDGVTTATTLTDAAVGKMIRITSGTADIDITTGSTNLAPNGSMWMVANVSGSNNTIDANTGITLTWMDGAGGSTGDRTLADGGICTIWKRSTSQYFIWGNGLS